MERLEFLEFFLKSFSSGFTTNRLPEYQQVRVVRGLEASSGSAGSAPLLEPSVSSLTRARRATWWCFYLKTSPGHVVHESEESRRLQRRLSHRLLPEPENA